MSDRGILIYIYDGTFEGLLTAVHYAYYHHQHPDEIVSEHDLQQNFMAEYIVVETDTQKSRAVYTSIPHKISSKTLGVIYSVFLSMEYDKGTIIYNYLRLGYKMGSRVDSYLQNDWVLKTHKISAYVGREAHLLKGFIRFSEMEGGVLYSPITPTNNILELLCPCFADRMPSQPWVICDKIRSIAGIYDTNQWIITQVDIAILPDCKEDDTKYRQLWRSFYNAIGIESRKNHNLRRQLMPKKYWKNMTEFQ